MLRSSNDLTSQQNFTIRVKRMEDGKFEATTPNVKGARVVSDKQQIAVAQLGDQLHKLHAEGKL